jgi:predicted nucleic-acid-binding Zn-ribbon protein
MVMAKLHIICGNCGCNDMFEYEVDPEGHDISDSQKQFKPAVFIKCRNCATLHDLSDTILEKTEKGLIE